MKKEKDEGGKEEVEKVGRSPEREGKTERRGMDEGGERGEGIKEMDTREII